MRCIFCLQERDSTLEHIFPDAIGGRLTTDRVCKPCNDHLGAQVDHFLTEHELIILKRAMLGMTNRAGRPINPWAKVFGEGILAADPDQRIQIVPDPKTGALHPRVMYNRTVVEGENGPEAVQVVIDASKANDLPKIVSRERKRLGLPDLDAQEMAKIVENLKANVQKIEQPSVRGSINIDIHDFKRAMLKIVYELAWLWLGDEYLEDPTAAALRDRVFNGNEVELEGRIDFDTSIAPFSVWNPEPDAHIALGRRAENRYVIGIRVFNVMAALVPVTRDATRYPDADKSHFILTDLVGSKSRNITLEEEIARLPKFMPR